MGTLTKSIVVFVSARDAHFTAKHGNLKFADDDLKVSLLPPVFRNLSTTINQFYWNIIPRYQSRDIAEQIEDLLGKTNIEEQKTHKITKARCTLQQLHEIQSMLVAAGPLGSQQIQADIVDRSIYITDIPYVTNEIQQLKEELETYFQRVTDNKLERLVCGIQGNLTKAIAVFHTMEDMNSFLEPKNQRDTDSRFLDEMISVSKLPPMFTDVTATCNELYFKLLPLNAKQKLQSAMEERSGYGLTITKNIISGSFHQVCNGRNVIMEAVGIASKEDSNERRFVVIGETGSGKSETSNSILHQRGLFKTSMSASSVTKTCMIEKAEVKDRVISIVDTPGFLMQIWTKTVYNSKLQSAF
ncbi:uncharacterized protein [Amphiura filiformis]|uniref:uncharacterized protein n=1 Tax=Amphiura filiformis TaxID=82378 RepID=UPI003B20D5C4